LIACDVALGLRCNSSSNMKCAVLGRQGSNKMNAEDGMKAVEEVTRVSDADDSSEGLGHPRRMDRCRSWCAAEALANESTTQDVVAMGAISSE